MVNTVKQNQDTILEVVGENNKALKTTPAYKTGTTTLADHYFGVIGNQTAYAGMSYVYQMDFKIDEYNTETALVLQVRTSNGTDSLVRVDADGYLIRETGICFQDKFGNAFKLTPGEFTTIAVLVNPVLNKYWVMIDGVLATQDGLKLRTTADATCYVSQIKAGYKTYAFSIDNAQLYFVDDTYTYEDYLGMFNPVKGNTATLGSTIGYNYYLNTPAEFLAANPDLTAKITVDGKTEKIKIADCPVTDYDVDGDGNVDNWVKVTYNLSAAEMTKEIKFELVQGVTVYSTRIDTIKAYAETVAAGTGAAAEAAKSMLVYGAYAQNYFGVNTDNLAADLSEVVLPELPADKQYKVEGKMFNYYFSAVSLQSEVIICHYFTSVEGLTFTVDGEELTAVLDGDLWRVEIAGINAANLDTQYALTVSDGENTYTFSYSAIAYAQLAVSAYGADSDIGMLVRALYAYNVAADAYVK